VKAQRPKGLDFEVEKLTNSIENVVTGDRFPTDVTVISMADLKLLTKKSGWQFDWKLEYRNPARDVYIDTLGAIHVGGRIMIIGTTAALTLINKYFPT
jgi:hypothetical protein